MSGFLVCFPLHIVETSPHLPQQTFLQWEKEGNVLTVLKNSDYFKFFHIDTSPLSQVFQFDVDPFSRGSGMI
jgi:hypothetical protein